MCGGGGAGRRGGSACALGDQRAEMRRLQQVEATAAVFGRKAVGIDGVGDEGAVRCCRPGFDLGQRHDLVDDAGQLQLVLLPSICGTNTLRL